MSRFSLPALCVFISAFTARAPGASVAEGSKPCEVATLHNGFTIQIAGREETGSVTTLQLCDGGSIQMPSDQIESYQAGEPPIPRPAPEPPAPKPAVKASIQDLIAGAAERHQIDPDFVTSVVKAESGFNSAAVSPKGAQGLMQLMPHTATALGVENPFDPAANVEAGTKYLRQLLEQYKGDAVKALAAYNAGSKRVEQYGGVPPYAETRAYINRIIKDYNRKKLQKQPDLASAAAPK